MKDCKCRRRKQLVKVRLYIVQPCWVFPMGPDGINSKWATVATYFSSTNCFWYSSYSSRVIPAALAGSEGVASSSLSPPPPRPIPDRGFPIMLLIKKAILSCVTVYSARTTIIFLWISKKKKDACSRYGAPPVRLPIAVKSSGSSLANLLLDYGAKDTLMTSNRHTHSHTHTHTHAHNILPRP